MATITSAQSGPWSAGSTWSDGSAPGPGDDIIIAAGHTVTLDADFTSEKSLTVSGRLNLAAILQTGNGTGKDCVFKLNPGATIEITTGHSWVFGNGTYQCKGTTGDFACIAGGGSMAQSTTPANPKIRWECEYLGVQATGDVRFPASSRAGDVSPFFSFSHCCFDGYSSLAFGTGGWVGLEVDMSFVACDFRGAGTVNIAGSTGTATGKREIRNCTFASEGTRGALRLTAGGPWQCFGTASVNHGLSAGAVSTIPVIWDGGFLANDCESSAPVFYSNFAGSMVKNAYVHTANRPPSYLNPHPLAVSSLENCILEVFGSEPNAFIPQRAVANAYCVGNLFFGNGDLFNYIGDHTADARITNNTVARFDDSVVGGLFLLENGILTDATEFGTRIRNNLHACLVVEERRANMIRASGMPATEHLSIDSDYNCIHNTQSFYQPDKVINKNSGEHDFRTDPLFRDSSRTITTWARMVTGDASAEYSDGYAVILLQNGYDAASKTQKEENIPAQGVDDLMAWVREGFTPQNLLLADSGEGGAYIGALPVTDTPIHRKTVGLTMQEKHLPHGSAPDAELCRAIVSPPPGWTGEMLNAPSLYGTLKQEGTNWVYTLTKAYSHPSGGGVAHDVDKPMLRMSHPELGLGLLTVSVSIADDATSLIAPPLLSGERAAEGMVTFDVGTNSPADLRLVVDGAAHPAGQLVHKNGWTVELALDPVVPVTGLGAGGGIFSPRLDPVKKRLLFLTCDMGGVYRSTDNGQSYALLDKRDIYTHHRGPGALFCANGLIIWPGRENGTSAVGRVMRSYDGGATWQRDGAGSAVLCGVPWRLGALLGRESGGLYYYYFGGPDFGYEGHGWTFVIEGGGEVSHVATVDANSGYYVHNGTAVKKFHKSEEEGPPVLTVLKEFASEIAGFDAAGQTLIASVVDDGVYRSTDEGATWARIHDYENINLVYIVPADADRFFLVQCSIESGKVWKTTDGGQTFADTFRMRGDNPNVELTWIQTDLFWSYYIVANGFCVLPGETPDRDVILISTQGELFRSDDGGDWFSAPIYKNRHSEDGLDLHESIGLEVTGIWCVKPDPFQPGLLHAMYTDVGAGLSPDNGVNWAGVSRTLRYKNTTYDLAFDPDTPGLMWVAASRLHDLPHWLQITAQRWEGAVEISSDYGKTWTRIGHTGDNPLPTRVCTSILVDPASPAGNRTLYAGLWSTDPFTYEEGGVIKQAGDDTGGVWKSTDNGQNWTRKVNGFIGINKHVYKLLMTPSGALYALVSGARLPIGWPQGGVYKSVDGAETWTFIGPTEDKKNTWCTDFVFGADENEIYVTTASQGGVSLGGLQRSQDNGLTWETIFDDATLVACLAGTGLTNTYDQYMCVFAEGDFILLGGTVAGAFFSYDRGATWRPWLDYRFTGLQSCTRLPDGRLALTSFGAGIFLAGYPHILGSASKRTATLRAFLDDGFQGSVETPVTVRVTDAEQTVTEAQSLIRLNVQPSPASGLRWFSLRWEKPQP